ncbi:MAG: branched-chain amino acid ABC transporter permease [Desulfobacteraceae bacterium]|nr:MAG: branched-chain amino acid ABC transporter permease [Desulfobacteraceae bacterium]
MELSQWIVQSLNGISYGMLLFLLASGLSLIFGLMGVINISHGSFYMLGAYVGVTVIIYSKSFVLGALVGGLSVAVFGMLLERYFLRPLYGQELSQMLLTFGVVLVIKDIARGIWGGVPYSIPEPAFLARSISILGSGFPVYRFAIIFIGLVVAAGLWFLIERTRIGAYVRAGVDDIEMVRGMGVNITLVFLAVIALGSFLAALGGVLGGPIFGAYPGLDFEILILALAVVIVGGMGTLKGPFIGSIIIGLLDNFGKAFFPNFSIFTIYAAMAIILVIRPKGIAGRGR